MYSNLQKSILKTVAYFHVFEYPITFSELYRFLRSKERVSRQAVVHALATLESGIDKQGKYYFLKGNEQLVKLREGRFRESAKKLKKTYPLLLFLSKLPTVLLLGISGSLSMKNAEKSDDIDIFIITRKNSLWITRFLIVTVLILLRKKRSKNTKHAQDAICPNMFLSADSLAFPVTRRELFLAHEILQLHIVTDKNGTYNAFLQANEWIQDFLPNIVLPRSFQRNVSKVGFVYARALSNLLNIFEMFFFALQYLVMKKSITGEIVTKTRAEFHPDSKNSFILKKYSTYYRKIVEEMYNSSKNSELFKENQSSISRLDNVL